MSSDKERQKLLAVGFLSSKLKETELLSRLESLHAFLKVHPQENERDLDIVAASLKENFLIAHSNSNLRLSVASCLVHIIRIYAPEAPYEAQELRRVFELFLSQLDGLSNPKSDSFKKVQDLLEKLVEVKAVVLLTQFEDLIVELFQKIFDIVNEEQKQLVVFMLDMLNTTIEFSESFPQEALEILLLNIIPGKGKSKNDQAVRLAQTVVSSNANMIGNQITNLILETIRNGSPESNTDFPAKARDIIFHLQSIKPELIVDILPDLVQEVEFEDLAIRTRAVHLLAKLFSNFTHLHIEQYALFNSFVKRFKDADASIRIVMVEFAKHMILRVDSDKTREDLSKELADRELDVEEPVRLEAVKATIDIGTESNLDKLTHPVLLERLVTRMRDKSVAVRSEAISGLAQLWHMAHDKWDQPASKKKSSSSSSSSGWNAERRRIWDPLPGKILSCYTLPDIDDKVRVEDILNKELLKPAGGAAQRASRLITLVRNDQHCRDIFGLFLREKGALRQDFIRFLESDRRDEAYARRKAAVAQHFPGCAALLDKIHDMNDEGLIKSLKVVAGANPSDVSTQDKRVKTAIEAVERRFGDGAKKGSGGKGMKDFISKLLVRLPIGFFDRQSTDELVGILSDAIGADDVVEIAKSLDLVEVLSKNLPSLFSGTCALVLVEMLQTAGVDNETAERLLHVLANVSASLSAVTSGKGGEELDDAELENYDIKKPLSKFCTSGTAAQAKWAVRVLVSSVGDGVDTMVGITKNIVASHLRMEELHKLSAYFATFKQIVKTNYTNLAAELTDAAEFAMTELLPVSVDSPRGEKKGSKKSSELSQMIQAKVQAIGFLVNLAKAIGAKVAVAAKPVPAAPAKKTGGKRKSQGSGEGGDNETSTELIKRIIALLSETVQHKDLADHETEADRTQLRISAASGLVRLARDRYIEKKVMSLDVWYTLADITCDSSNHKMRAAFADKLNRAHHDITQLPLKYLALLAFCSADSDSKIAAPSKKTLQTCILMRRKLKRDHEERILSHHESMSSDAATVEQRVASSLAVLLPEYGLPWLVHLIAHQPWFRNAGDSGKKREARFAGFDRACNILHIFIDNVSNGTDNFGFLRQMLLDIKQAEDPTDRRGDFVQEVAELADMLVKKREDKVLNSRGIIGGPKHGDVTAKILLPAEIYTVPEVGSSQEDIQLRSAKKRYISDKYRVPEYTSEHFKIGGAGPNAAASRGAAGRSKKRSRAKASDDEEESAGASSVEESSEMEMSISDSAESSKKKQKKKVPAAKKGAATAPKRRKTKESEDNSDEHSAHDASVESDAPKKQTTSSPSQRGTPRRAAAGKAQEVLQQQKAQTKQLKKREQEEDDEANASSEEEEPSAAENGAGDDKMDVDSDSESEKPAATKGKAKAAASAKPAPAAKRGAASARARK